MPYQHGMRDIHLPQLQRLLIVMAAHVIQLIRLSKIRLFITMAATHQAAGRGFGLAR